MKVFIFHLNKNMFFSHLPSNLHVNRSILLVLSSHGIHTLANVVIVDPRVQFIFKCTKNLIMLSMFFNSFLYYLVVMFHINMDTK
jgi:hypothetical protein